MKEIENAIELVNSFEASWFKENASTSEYGYYLNFFDNGTKMEIHYNCLGSFWLKLNIYQSMWRKEDIINELYKRLEK